MFFPPASVGLGFGVQGPGFSVWKKFGGFRFKGFGV